MNPNVPNLTLIKQKYLISLILTPLSHLLHLYIYNLLY